MFRRQNGVKLESRVTPFFAMPFFSALTMPIHLATDYGRGVMVGAG